MRGIPKIAWSSAFTVAPVPEKQHLPRHCSSIFLNDGRGCYLLSDDDYPHRIPKRNDEEQLRVYKEAGEDGLRGYLGTKKEIDFARINEVLAAFHEGKDTITLRHLERKDGEISSEETDFSGISVLLLEWTHGGSDDLHGVDLSVFLESSPEETKERRIRRNRDENAASPFICRVVELEQEKLEVQRKNAGCIFFFLHSAEPVPFRSRPGIFRDRL